MINKLLDVLYSFSNGTIVTSHELTNAIDDEQRRKYQIDVVNDARSAAFYAFGKSKNLFKPTILVLDKKGTTSTYTALTEASYQNIPVILVELSELERDNFLDFCTTRQFIIRTEEDYLKAVDSFSKEYSEIKFGPILFRILPHMEVYTNKINDTLLKTLDVCLNKEDTLWVSNLDVDSYGLELNFQLFTENEYAYGIVSKYFGYILNAKNTVLLACTSQDAYLDINIFNCRYLSSKLKIVIFEKTGYEIDIQKWIEANGIVYMRCKQLDEKLIENVVKNDKPIVVYVGEGGSLRYPVWSNERLVWVVKCLIMVERS